MAVSLKDINRAPLVVAVLGNLAVYYLLMAPSISLEAYASIFKSYENLLPSALVAILVGILNAQLGHQTKARLVFWRWHHPLPGSRAFTKHLFSDSRIDPSAIRAHVNPLPTDPKAQNALWYKWLKEFEAKPAIQQAHREYLFTRDWTGLIALMSFPFLALAAWQMEPDSVLYLTAILATEYLLVRNAAKKHGERLVTSVLALKAS